MKRLLLLVGMISAITIAQNTSRNVANIIFDTDMGPDYDDVGAITVLHALANKKECNILATVASDAYPAIPQTIQVFNEYFGRGDILVGAAVDGAPNFTAKNKWNDSIVSRYGNQTLDKKYPSALTIYRKVLAAQKDQSVTIVTVGFLSNLEKLLKSGPDEFSKLTGKQLVNKKVKKWVAMAGAFPEGREFNIFKHEEASRYTIKNWPTPILFSGFEIGSKILTGNKIAQQGIENSPVAWAYGYNLKTYAEKAVDNRQSWDQTAVLVAVRDPQQYFYLNGPGVLTVVEDGANTWEPSQKGSHHFLTHKFPYQKIADEIDDLMLAEPIKK